MSAPSDRSPPARSVIATSRSSRRTSPTWSPRPRNSASSPGEPSLHPIDLELDPKTRLVGTVRVDHAAPPGPVRITYSQLKAKHLVAPWLELLALVAEEPDSRLAGGDRVPDQGRDKADRRVLRPIGDGPTGASGPRACRARHRRRVLPTVPGRTHPALLRRCRSGCTTARRVVSDWDDYKGFADGDDTSNQLAFGEFDFYELLAIPARRRRSARYAPRDAWNGSPDGSGVRSTRRSSARPTVRPHLRGVSVTTSRLGSTSTTRFRSRDWRSRRAPVPGRPSRWSRSRRDS